MAARIGIGTSPVTGADDLISVTVLPGQTVVVQNLASSVNTINYHSKGHGGGVTGSVAKNSSTNLTVPGTHYLTCAGRADLVITGGQY